MIYSEPLKEIVVKPAEVKELYLGKKGFNALRDFGKFINLEVLWMNENLVCMNTYCGREAKQERERKNWSYYVDNWGRGLRCLYSH